MCERRRRERRRKIDDTVDDTSADGSHLLQDAVVIGETRESGATLVGNMRHLPRGSRRGGGGEEVHSPPISLSPVPLNCHLPLQRRCPHGYDALGAVAALASHTIVYCVVAVILFPSVPILFTTTHHDHLPLVNMDEEYDVSVAFEALLLSDKVLTHRSSFS